PGPVLVTDVGDDPDRVVVRYTDQAAQFGQSRGPQVPGDRALGRYLVRAQPEQTVERAVRPPGHRDRAFGRDAALARAGDQAGDEPLDAVLGHQVEGSGKPEAGRGGKVCVKGGEQGTTCIGLTGSFDLVTKHGVKRLVTGLISGAGEGGVAAEGPVSVSRGPNGSFYGLFGLSSHEVPPKGVIPGYLRAAALAELGRLVRVS